jgi:Na+/H+ antiporter NhaC
MELPLILSLTYALVAALFFVFGAVSMGNAIDHAKGLGPSDRLREEYEFAKAVRNWSFIWPILLVIALIGLLWHDKEQAREWGWDK